MSEPSALAEIPADLSKPAESIKDAHLDPAHNDEDASSASEGENEDFTPVNGAGPSCTSVAVSQLTGHLWTAKKKKKSAFSLRIAFASRILIHAFLRAQEEEEEGCQWYGRPI